MQQLIFIIKMSSSTSLETEETFVQIYSPNENFVKKASQNNKITHFSVIL